MEIYQKPALTVYDLAPESAILGNSDVKVPIDPFENVDDSDK